MRRQQDSSPEWAFCPKGRQAPPEQLKEAARVICSTWQRLGTNVASESQGKAMPDRTDHQVLTNLKLKLPL